MKDNFSSHADKYARYRPGYPKELFEYISGLANAHELAWDCGTGNGQAASQLSKYFNKIYATDISAKQLDNAVRADNIIYAQEPAEKVSLADGSTDLITVSQALHWFDISSFHKEAKRVGKVNAIIAIWTYSLLQVNTDIDELINAYHYKTLKEHWDPERKHVDDGYANIPFPFTPLPSPSFNIVLNWQREDIEGYINTWSGTQKFIAVNNYNPVNDLMKEVYKVWPAGKTERVNFPIHLKVGRVH